MNRNKNTIISTEDLKIGYTVKKKELVIAENLNIELERGHFVGLIGKNGIGKSTLLRTLTKVQAPLSGKIFIDKTDIRSLDSPTLSKMMSLVLTERLPDNNLSVFELVALGRQPYTNWIGTLTNEDLRIIQEAFDKTHTSHLKDARYAELSDGQLQKVLIARALAQDTAIIILDEPTAHLDLHHTIETFTLLKNLAAEFGKTIIISTHEINLALQIADTLWLMTPDSFRTGPTNSIISENAMESLFQSELISFNKSLNQFTIR